MGNQLTYDQQENPSLGNLIAGNWLTIVAGCVYIVSLFLDWASAGGWLYSKGTVFLVGISNASGLPGLQIVTLLAAVGCILLCVPFLRRQWQGIARVAAMIQVVLSFLGLLPFVLLPFELETWIPKGELLFGGWLGLLAAFGLLIGAIWTLVEARQQ